MIVITLTDCPPKVRGDLSKWLLEISTGVYVGNLSARVRDELWGRVCEHVKEGRATMVYSSNGEQKLDFAIHNTRWLPVDYDGIKLVRKPGSKKREQSESRVETKKLPMSRAEKMYQVQQIQKSRARKQSTPDYVVLDLETTGLNPLRDQIIEIAAIRVKEGKEISYYQSLISCEQIPETVIQLTGITREILEQEGKPMDQVLKEVLEFIGDTRIVSHNASFDWRFLQQACRRSEMKLGHPPLLDTLNLARQKVDGVEDYKLLTLSKHFHFAILEPHRALADCRLTHQLYEKLKRIEAED